MLAASIPYLLGFAAQGGDWVFSGFVFGIEDGNSYIAKMLTGYTGDWLFRTPYTTYPQTGLLVLFPYILLGKLTAPPAQYLQMVALFHLFRFGAGMLAVWAAYDFLAVFVKEINPRRWGLVAATLGGGLGWLLVILGKSDLYGSLPLDFYSPESFGFLSLYGIPHLSLARALLLWGIAWVLRTPVEAGGWGDVFKPESMGVFVGLVWLLNGVMQPLTVVVGWAVLGVHLAVLAIYLWRTKESRVRWFGALRRGFWVALLSSPMVLYTAIAFATDPFAQAWTAQNTLPSPHPVHYLLAFGLLLPLVVWGARRIWKEDVWKGSLLVGWVVALPFLVYLPVSVQRRTAEGVWVALVALAVVALQNKQRWLPLLSITTLTSLFLLVGGISTALTPFAPVFRPKAETVFFEAIRPQIQEDAVVLASYDTANALPAWVPVKVVVGHGPESIDWRVLKPEVAAFYSGETSDEVRKAFIERYHIQYVVWGPEERKLGIWTPEGANFLEFILESEDYRLYRVLD
jgi:hypothetical protein